MLKRKALLLVFVISVFLNTFKVLSAATNCEQVFTFFAYTTGFGTSWEQGTFWIGEDVGGECLGSKLIQISISDGKVSSSYASLMGFEEWDWLKEGVKHLQKELPKELIERNGVWSCSSASFHAMPPPSDSVMLRLFRQAFNNGMERSWNELRGIKGISLPVFKGVKAELLYYYEKGVYVAYGFSHIYYFPHSKYLLIFTHQPMMASGLDTMHGFLIFKIQK
jgi:hypothetical protein